MSAFHLYSCGLDAIIERYHEVLYVFASVMVTAPPLLSVLSRPNF
jgi:hypothetical protein